jgi:hypothetical protein
MKYLPEECARLSVDLRRLWAQGVPSAQICELLKISQSKLEYYRRKLQLIARPWGRPKHSRQQKAGINPTATQIKATCLEIQETWTDAERERRLIGYVYTPVTTKIVETPEGFDEQWYEY